MTLLDQATLDDLIGIIQSRTQEQVDVLRDVIFAGTPPGMERLDSPEKRGIIERTVARNADQEERGAIPGNLNRTMLQHPAMVAMIEEDLDDARG